MTKPTISGNIIQIPIKYLLKQYKKDSGYKEAKKIHGASNVTKHDRFRRDAFIAWTIEGIADNLEGWCNDDYEYVNIGDIHSAFREVAPFMFKSEHDNADFLFDWLKKPFAEVLTKGEEIDITITERQIRIMKMIALINPNAVLNIKMPPRAND